MRQAVLGVLLLLGACGSSSAPAPGPAAAVQPAPLEVTDQANGQTLRLTVGQELVLTLSECGSCGYKWSVTERLPFLTEIARADIPSGDSDPPTGGSITIQYHFSADRPGSGRLTLKNTFPPRVTDGPTLTFNVEVR